MARKQWPAIIERRYPSGNKAFTIDVMVRGERFRETFDNWTDAEAKALELRMTREQIREATLTLAQRNEAAKVLPSFVKVSRRNAHAGCRLLC